MEIETNFRKEKSNGGNLKLNFITVLRFACFFVFFGRAWQHLFWDSPLRTIFWDEALLSGLFETYFQISWHQYVTNGTSDFILQSAIRLMGVIFLFAAFAAIRVSENRKIDQLIIGIGSGLLGLLAFLYYKEKFYHAGQFFEYASQVGAPVFLLMAIQNKKNLELYLKFAIALTFGCHGLYAIGYYPVPGDFQDMTMNILGVSNSQALFILKVAGVLDLFIVVGLFIPRLVSLSVLYCIGWGIATALARVVSNTTSSNVWWDLHQWAPETIHRLPHGLIPLALFILYQNQKVYSSCKSNARNPLLHAPLKS